MLRKSRKQLTTRFLHRAVLFFTAFSVCLALFFFFGNVQEFLDTTQRMILAVLSLASLITVLLAVILLVLELVLLIAQRKKLYLLLVAMCLVCLIVSAGLALASHAILLLSAGM